MTGGYSDSKEIVNNINKNNKSNNYKNKLNINNNNDKDVFNEIPHENYSDKKMWQTAKELTNNSKQKLPRVISHEGTLITSVTKICNIANNHYLNKINKI